MSMTRKIISLLLVILLLPLVACDTQEEPFVMPQETDTLVIYDTPFLTESLLKAITLFRAQYPEVSVEFRRFDSVNNGDITAYHTMLYAELAAGQGPDIILESDTFTFNIGSFKRMESGVYADLEPFFQHDENFQMSDYHEIVLDAGVFQGKRYAVPLSFVSSYWLTTQEILEEEGITIEEDLQDYTSLMNLLQDYRQSNPEKRLFYNIYARQFLNDMFPWNGLPLVNIEEKQVSVDPDKLHYVIDTYRDVFYVESIVNAPSVIPNYGFGLLNRETIFQ